MARIYKNVEELVGRTPLLEIERFAGRYEEVTVMVPTIEELMYFMTKRRK